MESDSPVLTDIEENKGSSRYSSVEPIKIEMTTESEENSPLKVSKPLRKSKL